jgi:hypothetical protein
LGCGNLRSKIALIDHLNLARQVNQSAGIARLLVYDPNTEEKYHARPGIEEPPYVLADSSLLLGSLLVYRLGIDAASGASAKHTRPEHPPLPAKTGPSRSCSQFFAATGSKV